MLINYNVPLNTNEPTYVDEVFFAAYAAMLNVVKNRAVDDLKIDQNSDRLKLPSVRAFAKYHP